MTQADRKALLQMRTELGLTVEGDTGCEFPPIVQFDELEGVVPDFAMNGLLDNGADAPTPLQAQVLPLVLSGHDVNGIAQAGAGGKTVAYMLPAIVHIEAQEPLGSKAATPVALVLVPTRELAVQVASEAQKLLQNSKRGQHRPLGIGIKSLYGSGAGKLWQVDALKRGCHIIVATPGRLLELVDAREISLERVTYFVLDEADRILSDGFEEQVCAISTGIRPDRHTLIFSETWPEAVQDLAEKVCNPERAPVTVTHAKSGLGGGPVASDDVIHDIIVFDGGTWEERDEKKQALMYEHLREALSHESHKVLVYASGRKLADTICTTMRDEGFRAESIHGARGQDRRVDILERFRLGEIQLLATTEERAAHVNIPDISHVVIYDMGEMEEYMHQIGRVSPGPYGRGHTLLLYEYSRKWPHLPSKLIEVLEQAEQEVPEDLRTIAHEAASGLREAHWGAHGS